MHIYNKIVQKKSVSKGIPFDTLFSYSLTIIYALGCKANKLYQNMHFFTNNYNSWHYIKKYDESQ